MGKQNGLCLYNGTLFCLKKEWNSDTCYDIDEPWTHCDKWNKPDTKRKTLWLHFYDIAGGGGSLAAKSCLTFATPMDCSLPGSSVHAILQARLLRVVKITETESRMVVARGWGLQVGGRKFIV